MYEFAGSPDQEQVDSDKRLGDLVIAKGISSLYSDGKNQNYRLYYNQLEIPFDLSIFPSILKLD